MAQLPTMSRDLVHEDVPVVQPKFYFDWIKDIPDQTDRVAVVTGSNTGIGFWAAYALATKGAKIVMACRNTTKAEAAKAELERILREHGHPVPAITVLALDTSKFATVHSFVEQFNAQFDRCDLLLNNAGVMAQNKRKTEDGHDIQIQTNALGHILLTNLLLPKMIAASEMSGIPSRVVQQSSQAHAAGSPAFGPNGSLDDGRFDACCGCVHMLGACCPLIRTWGRYGQSKLANILFANELDRRLRSAQLHTKVMSMSSEPGLCSTNLQKVAADDGNMPCWRCLLSNAAQSPQDGSMPILMAATVPNAESGMYYEPENGRPGNTGRAVQRSSLGKSNDKVQMKRFWKLATEATGADWSILDNKN